MSRHWRVALAVTFAALIVLRIPSLLPVGRFWAEDGSTFFMRAWQMRWYSALLAPSGGYLNIVANVAGILAWYAVPLRWAPYMPMVVGLVFQICPGLVLLTSRSAWLDHPLVMTAALLLIATPLASEGMHLNAIGAQVYLTLCAALILALAPDRGVVGLFHQILLGVGVLSGPGPWLLTPLFAARAAIDRSGPRAAQAAVLGVGVFLQVTLFYSHDPGRAYAVRPILFLDAAWTRHILAPYLGPDLALDAATRIRAAVLMGHGPWLPPIAMSAILLVAAAAVARAWRSAPFWMLLSAVILEVVGYVGSLGDFLDMLFPMASQRYTFAPQVLIALSLLCMAASWRGPIRLVAAGLVVWLLTVSLSHYFESSASTYAHGPSWRDELALRCRDPGHVIAGWPRGWPVPLPAGEPHPDRC